MKGFEIFDENSPRPGPGHTVRTHLCYTTLPHHPGVNVALVKALGTMLKEGGASAAGDGIMLQPADEGVLLQQSLRESVATTENSANALSDLKIFSAALVDCLEFRIAHGQWPIRHVHFLCENVAASNDSGRALHLAGSLLHRLHSASFQTSDRALLLKSLGALQPLVAAGLYSQVLPFLESGDAKQRARVMAAAVEIKLQCRGEDAIRRLARCLLLDVGAASTHAASGTSLLSYVLKEEAEKCKGVLLREKSTVVLFLGAHGKNTGAECGVKAISAIGCAAQLAEQHKPRARARTHRGRTRAQWPQHPGPSSPRKSRVCDCSHTQCSNTQPRAGRTPAERSPNARRTLRAATISPAQIPPAPAGLASAELASAGLASDRTGLQLYSAHDATFSCAFLLGLCVARTHAHPREEHADTCVPSSPDADTCVPSSRATREGC